MKLENATMKQKVNYVKGRLYSAGKGEKLRLNKIKLFFDVVDADGNILKTATIDGILYWLDKEKED